MLDTRCQSKTGTRISFVCSSVCTPPYIHTFEKGPEGQTDRESFSSQSTEQNHERSNGLIVGSRYIARRVVKNKWQNKQNQLNHLTILGSFKMSTAIGTSESVEMIDSSSLVVLGSQFLRKHQDISRTKSHKSPTTTHSITKATATQRKHPPKKKRYHT